MEGFFEAIKNFFMNFLIFNINGINSIIYFLKNNIIFFLVLACIFYMIYLELQNQSYEYVDDERRII